MKNIQIRFLFLLAITFTFSNVSLGQNQFATPLQFEVNKIHPYISISPVAMEEAQSLSDLNRHYKPDWVRSYINVEISSLQNGQVQKANSKGEQLSSAQKKLIQNADVGTDIKILIHYIPENNLQQNEAKKMDFTFTIEPKTDAVYPGGQAALDQYLKTNAIDKITKESFKDFDLAAIQFTINEEGEIIDAHIFESVYQSYKNEAVNQLLLETIRKMPCWKPAEYTNGTKARQQFVLSVGNQESCLVNLLNTIQR